MSVKTTTRIWEHSNQSSSDLLLLLAIADHTDDDGVCWPGIPTLAKETRSSDRQTQRNVEKLAERGEIYISRRCGRGNGNLYFITVGLTKDELVRILRVRFELGTQAEAEAKNILSLQALYQQPNGDTDDTIYEEQKGDIQDKKVTSRVIKGDIAMSPETCEPSINHITPNGVGGNLPPPPDKPPGPKTVLKDRFLELTSLEMPGLKSDAGFWWGQFGKILKISKGDVILALDTMSRVVKYMQTEGLSIIGPQSVVGLCRSVASGQKLNGKNGNGTHKNGTYKPTNTTTESKIRKLYDLATKREYWVDQYGNEIPAPVS